MEMEKVQVLKDYKIDEIEKMDPVLILNIINDFNKKIKENLEFLNNVKKEKRGYKHFGKENEEISKDNINKAKLKDYTKKLENNIEKQNRKIDQLMKSNLALKMKKDPFENKLFENVSANNIGFELGKERENKNKSIPGKLDSMISSAGFNSNPKIRPMSGTSRNFSAKTRK